MKVTHLSHQDGKGGAAVATKRLHGGLRAIGVDSAMIVGRKFSADPSVESFLPPLGAKLLKRLDKWPRTFLRTRSQSLISPAWVGAPVWRAVNRRSPDIAHLHWVCDGFLRIEALNRLKAPIAWSLHDMWALGGGEHYVEGCGRYKDGYLAANRPAGESGFDLNRWVWRRKRRAWAAVPEITLFAVSHWLADRARESVLFRERPIEVLHNGLDAQVFKPQGQHAAREALGLPPRIPLVLYGALEATTDKRKGFDLLRDALGHLRARTAGLELVVFGNGPGAGAEGGRSEAFKTHYLGRIDDPSRLSTVYAACNVMVVPSRQESFGQTALEALACGTPVAAFRIGGIPEIVQHLRSGYLAEAFDTAELARGIQWILDRGDGGRGLAAEGRATVEKKFTLAIQAQRCLELYGQILERAP